MSIPKKDCAACFVDGKPPPPIEGAGVNSSCYVMGFVHGSLVGHMGSLLVNGDINAIFCDHHIRLLRDAAVALADKVRSQIEVVAPAAPQVRVVPKDSN